MVVAQDQFIQITVAVAPNTTVLHALDASGNVWWFDYNRNAWRAVPLERV